MDARLQLGNTMKARSQDEEKFQIDEVKSDQKENQEEKAKEIKQITEEKQTELLHFYPFKEPLLPTSLDQLPNEGIDDLISSMLPFEDQRHLMSVSKNVHQFFRTTYSEAYLKLLNQLLHSVVYGQPKNVEDMIKKYTPLLTGICTLTL
jgi:hypothetical protein